MKYLFTLLILSVFSLAQAQDGITVCHTPATEKFALFASNSAFNSDHPEPPAYIHKSISGEMIEFSTPDGKSASAFYLKPEIESNKFLLVIHEWWGLNDHIKREAEKLFNDLNDVHVLALDMYDGNVASTREDAQKYMSGMSSERGKNIVEGALNFAGENAIIGTIGWCFGGGWSLESILLADQNAAACVMFYGMPINDVERLKELRAPVLGIFGSEDQWINPEVVETFSSNMTLANKDLTIEMYEANHAFANPSNPEYDEKATRDAYMKTLAFLVKNM
jgi:carboxymethylenebutenolidase